MSRAPNLCRLCEFPCADSGVPVDTLDAEKLAKWWKQNLGTEFEILTDAEEAHRLFICRFCIWEARFAYDNGSPDDCSGSTVFDWWSGHDDDHFYREYFYKKPLIQPCKVVLKKDTSDPGEDLLVTTSALLMAAQICSTEKLELQHHGCPEQDKIDFNRKSAKKIAKCTFCNKIFSFYNSISRHIKRKHKNAVRCKSQSCATYFLTDIERRQHEEKIHLSEGAGKHIKCIFCESLISGRTRELNIHIKQMHKDAIKCDFDNRNPCTGYFYTEAEKNKHIIEVHNKIDLDPVQCICCGKKLNKYCLMAHVRINHANIIIKCRLRGCLEYFFNQIQSEEHYLQVHQDSQTYKNFQCQKCSFRTNKRINLRNHLLTVHRTNKEATFKCLLCPKAFFVKDTLKVHLRVFHVERSTCEHCGKTMLKTSMKRHFLSQHAS